MIAFDRSGVRFNTFAIATTAGFVVNQVDGFLDASGSLDEGDRDADFPQRPKIFSRAGASRSLSGVVVEIVLGKLGILAEDAIKQVFSLDVGATERSPERASFACFRGSRIKEIGAEIVFSLFVVVGEHVISLGDLLESFLGVFVVGMAVRMVFLGHLEISLLDNFRVGVTRNAENFVPVFSRMWRRGPEMTPKYAP